MPSEEDNEYFKLVDIIYQLIPDVEWCHQHDNSYSPTLMKILTCMCIHLSYSQMEKLVKIFRLYDDIPEEAVENVLRFLYTLSLFDDDVKNCTWKNLFHFLQGTYTEENSMIWLANLYRDPVRDLEWDPIIDFLPDMIKAEIKAARK